MKKWLTKCFFLHNLKIEKDKRKEKMKKRKTLDNQQVILSYLVILKNEFIAEFSICYL